MAISTQTTKVRYVGDGVATSFPIPFPVYNPAHVRVFTSDANDVSEEMTAGFDVYEETPRTYAISFYEPLPAGQDITIARLLPLTQDLDLENGGNFAAEEIETTFDQVVMLIQQLQEELGRSVKTGIAAEKSGLSVEEIYAQIAIIVQRAEDALYAIQNLVQPVILDKGVTNLRGTWTTRESLPAGSLLSLPVGYFPKREMLLLMMDGFTCYPAGAEVPASLPQYEEVGEEDEFSRHIRLLFDAPAGAVWSAWSIASNVAPRQEELLEQTQQAKDLAAVAAEEAQISEQRAQAYADRSCDCATVSLSAADDAKAIAEGLPGFINGAHAFFGLRMEGSCLMLDKYEDGEEIDTAQYGYTAVLPAEAQFYLEDGSIKVRLPFTI